MPAPIVPIKGPSGRTSILYQIEIPIIPDSIIGRYVYCGGDEFNKLIKVPLFFSIDDLVGLHIPKFSGLATGRKIQWGFFLLCLEIPKMGDNRRPYEAIHPYR
jgi:hypothetical protein